MRARLSDLLRRPVDASRPVDLLAVVGLDASELEAGFLAARNNTVMLSALMLLIGAVGTYFLFTAAHYRSVRSALANMQSYTANLIENMPSGLVSVGPDGDVVTVNSRARSMLSLVGDARGKRVEDVLSIETPEDRAAVNDVVAGRAGFLETETRIAAARRKHPRRALGVAAPRRGRRARGRGAALSGPAGTRGPAGRRSSANATSRRWGGSRPASRTRSGTRCRRSRDSRSSSGPSSSRAPRRSATRTS